MPSLALAQGNAGSWPTRPVRVISPYGAGGSNDISARIVCEELGRRLGQQFIVENKPGAGTRLGNEMVARATPDGYTLLFAAAPFAIVESLYGKLSYDPRKDFKPISLAVVAPIFLVVNAASPFKTVADLVAHGKANPQGLTFASPGAGSGPHLAGELFFREAKVKGLTVHFRGDATAYTELLAGRVDATLTAITSALPHVQSGKLRVLAVASDARSPVYAEAPTMAEQGFPGVVGYGWFGMMAPAGTPDAVVGKVNAEMKAILEDAGVRQKMLAMGLQAQGSSPAEFAAFIGKETTKWAAVVKAADIKGE
ncbi:tripartite tricarboxylate transporter substrate binding protein [Variovorax dokdonensis]|uniref:Tripartite tricarboxylate transporter substrate binding protein n=2 Tax=Variovorax dokdonensis TaxID=344883 RepID=A0ABT7NGL8_9BURK|nr:tripartite tricarboxylate transporter substrate binding protein [Variovorax dokdonensis]MDM0047100.1 tripartite tricarboxylate transporter substrate binding protein [Variovorax dokdonensis]